MAQHAKSAFKPAEMDMRMGQAQDQRFGRFSKFQCHPVGIDRFFVLFRQTVGGGQVSPRALILPVQFDRTLSIRHGFGRSAKLEIGTGQMVAGFKAFGPKC